MTAPALAVTRPTLLLSVDSGKLGILLDVLKGLDFVKIESVPTAHLSAEELQDLEDFCTFQAIASKSKATQNDVLKLVKRTKQNWRLRAKKLLPLAQ